MKKFYNLEARKVLAFAALTSSLTNDSIPYRSSFHENTHFCSLYSLHQHLNMSMKSKFCESHFYRKTGMWRGTHFWSQNIDCGYLLEPPLRAFVGRFYLVPTINVFMGGTLELPDY